MGMGRTIRPGDFFLSCLESQRSINTHIHEIEPSTPIFLYEIDLNEIKVASIRYPSTSGPITDGVIRIHNDFNLFNINRGIIYWRGNAYFPFPIYGEQFDITSNGAIPTPKIKFSSQFLDDEYNSFYKYIRMQINELKDIIGSKVTRRKSFVRYLHPSNFPGSVNPFNTYSDTPWVSRDGATLTIRSLNDLPPYSVKWLVYYYRSSQNSNKIFGTLKTDDKTRTLDISSQRWNYFKDSNDIFNFYVADSIIGTTEPFSLDLFIIKSNNSNFTNIYEDSSKEYKKINTNDSIKVLCGTSLINFTSSSTATISYPVSFSTNQIATFISCQNPTSNINNNFNYAVTGQTSNNIDIKFSNTINGPFNINYLSIPTGVYTGTNPYINNSINMAALTLTNNFGTGTSGELNIAFPVSFNNNPKILFNAWGNSGFIYNQYIKNISNTGCTFVAHGSSQLNVQNINLLITDDDVSEDVIANSTQIYTTYHNFGYDYFSEIEKKKFDTYEVELSPDIFYIDRKVQEDAINVVYELSSLLDVEGVKLPSRLLLSKNCPLTYRGEGCCYERKERLTLEHHGVYGLVDSQDMVSGANVVNTSLYDYQIIKGLQSAPPVSDEGDNVFSAFINGTNWIDRGTWQEGTTYNPGNYIFIQKNGINYYFVCKTAHLSDGINLPPNMNYWFSDTCSKTLKGCRLRWIENPNFSSFVLKADITKIYYDALQTTTVKSPSDHLGRRLAGILPFGGFPSVEGKYQSQQSSMTS